MKTAFFKALALIAARDEQLLNIISVTLRMAFSSSIIALILGVFLGILLGMCRGRKKAVFVVLNRTLMGLPPVVIGLLGFILLSGVGPLRHLKMLYTVKAMIAAQVVLLTPLAAGSMEAHVSEIVPGILQTTRGLGLSTFTTLGLILNECRYQVLSSYLLILGRGFAEVGAISIVGGAIAYKTNVMTTAIMNYSNMGNITIALALGIILLMISLTINILATVFYYAIGRRG